MTPHQLAAKIRYLREAVPITDEFERILTRRGTWNRSYVWYTSQKQHWLGWLSEYHGRGYYGRKNSHRSAEFVYNHINCPPMVLWLVEASGIPRTKVAKAKQAALSAKPHLPAQSAAIRKTIPWEMIEVRLDKSGSMAKKSSTPREAGKKAANTRKLTAANGRQAGKTRLVHWVESDELDNLGHGVQFLHDKLQHEYDYTHPDRIAFLEGYGWQHGGPATVRLLGISPPSINADHWSEIVQTAREAVLDFLSNEGKQNSEFRHGPIHILFNA